VKIFRRHCFWVSAFVHGCPGKNLESVYMCLMETGICTEMRVLDSGLRMCREKAHAEARSRGATRIATKSTKGAKKGSRAKARKSSLCALCSLW